MKITLFLNNKMLVFKLPTIISGNFSFDENEMESSKLINIVAKNNKWYLYQTEDVKVKKDAYFEEQIEIEQNSFYRLERDNKEYIIYTENLEFKSVLTYSYMKNSTISIGNQNNNTFFYDCSYLNNSQITIEFKENEILFQKNGNCLTYLNKLAINNEKVNIYCGDELEIYGLNIIFLHDIIIVNRLDNLNINMQIGNSLSIYNFPDIEEPQKLEIKELDLYSENDYYSKAPRLRRVISTETIKLSAPPKQGDSQELPLLLVIGPMLTMGVSSFMMLTNNLMRLQSGEVLLKDAWPQLVTSIAMLISMLLWPLITQSYNRHQKVKIKKEITKKYTKYLNDKRKELESIRELQKNILYENLISIDDCLKIINTKNIGFWDKRIDQSDFLTVRLGIGKEFLDVKIEYPDEGFSIEENELRDQADKLVAEFKYIDNVPLGYSLKENKITAIMGVLEKSIYFTENLLLQLIAFYSYDDLKIVLFTSKERKRYWRFLRYLHHNFNNERNFRFFSENREESEYLSEYLNYIIQNRIYQLKSNKSVLQKPHYLIVVDGWDSIYQNDFIRELTENDEDLGFSIVIIENRMNKLPSKCNNFISLNGANSKVLKNSYNEQVHMSFSEEIHTNIDMVGISKILSNIPIEFEEGFKELPESLTFLEMEQVGRVEQLNILNRWNTNDSTNSLKAEIGVNERGDLMYLDLHEKYHGPHGLIAGMTGSGKSEFIITYILSMAINYSPDDVAFILIDYKGGGLAFAFENKANNIVLPHLAGTITNLDKAEMDRTLVSIDSEIKRRQQIFNKVRDTLGESTIDIYKYQKFFKEGRIKEAVPHLFIICDEFAELKSQQPDFMDNLISVARIGRSLGVHLILATQKPSGVVNDQIWSNTKFRVCLKVQDESDSKEMLKRPEAASIKQTGRYYLQVGFDEYFALGQSAWCGAKYYPSDRIVKQVDNSLNYINNYGGIIKSVQASNNIKVDAEGEQLAAIMQNIIAVASQTNKFSRRLWLENIPEIILEDTISKKYNVTRTPYKVCAVIGEYDAPEQQEQGLVLYDFLENGNTIIYGTDGGEREKLLQTIIYSSSKGHTAEELNFYIIDFGSESLRIFKNLLHVGGIVFASEDEKYHNLMKLLKEELQKRKRLFADYGGDYENYIASGKEKIPLKVIIINNYDSVYENYPELYDDLPELIRDSERYGIIFIMTATSVNSVASKISQNCPNIYAFRMKDNSDYLSLFGVRSKVVPREIEGRGLLNNDGIHEFQVCTIKENDLNEFFQEFIKERNKITSNIATKIPVLPNIVRFDDVKSKGISKNSLPIGISKKELEIVSMDLVNNQSIIVSSNRISNTLIFIKSILHISRYLPNTNLLIIDPLESLNLSKMEYPNYYIKDLDIVLDQIIDYLNKLKEMQNGVQGIIFVYGFNKFVDKLKDKNKLNTLMDILKEYEKFSIVAIDEPNKIKTYAFESWFTKIFNTSEGVWIGRGVTDQTLLKLSTITKEMTKDYKTDMGYFISENIGTLCKFIDFYSSEDEKSEK